MRQIEDVKKGLACQALGRNRLLPCSDCAYHGPGLPHCSKAVHEDAIALIDSLIAVMTSLRICELCKHNVIDWTDRCKEADYSCADCKDIGCKCRTCNAHHSMWEWREDRGAK